MNERVEREEIEIPKGTTMSINDDLHVIESGTMIVEKEPLYSVGGNEPVDGKRSIHFEVTFSTPDDE